jgi:hypothetical protein
MVGEINILITGDFYPGGAATTSLIKKKKYEDIFNDYLPVIRDCDYAITNLEAPLTNNVNNIAKTGPVIKADPESIKALTFAKFNMVTLANNHIMDYGMKGLLDTMNVCKENGIRYIGAGLNFKAASETRIITIADKQIAFINIAENEFSTTSGDKPGVNPLDLVSNYHLIQEAKKKADFVIIIIHGGHENYSLPSPRIKKTYRFFVDCGANAVIGHHTHCVSGYEVYKESPIFYSLGNFLFEPNGIKGDKWYYGFAVQLIIKKNKIMFKLHPYFQNKGFVGLRKMKSQESESFFNEITNLNQIILDDDLLAKNFEDFIKKVTSHYQAYLEPHSNRYIRYLQRKKFIPSFLGNKKRLLYLNLIRCEAHKDIILNVLEK